ncbi:hypothetical protein [Shewanella sp. YLB-07]|uniref:hypothetical protein n=1 Tax=Shewanella sp. YLB-07 TaxID=2601268 RepID=UPI00128E610A|nr:hypothetical protein [Shewanella sp. YLB-07]MPY23927.1 hypothetical protein [Shewanella sp. YLB-07]
MKNCSIKNDLNGLLSMKPKTRSFFLANFNRENGTIDTKIAAAFFHVTTRTINNWVITGCPDWVDHYVSLYERSIPDSKEWDGFKFVDGRLYTPYDRLTFAPSELLKIFYDRQFNRFDRVEKNQLKIQVSELRNDDEAEAIREEIDIMIRTLEKVKQSPIVAEKMVFSERVRIKSK